MLKNLIAEMARADISQKDLAKLIGKDERSNKYGFEFKFDKYNNFNLFGVKVVQTSHGSISGLGRIRGMTAFGAYVNEASLANQEVFDEIKTRCSGRDARIIADTNPDHPEHWLLKDYIRSGASGILSNHFSLDDNTFLDERYVREIKSTTPKGMFYDRGVKGLWVSGDGVVYLQWKKSVILMIYQRLWMALNLFRNLFLKFSRQSSRWWNKLMRLIRMPSYAAALRG